MKREEGLVTGERRKRGRNERAELVAGEGGRSDGKRRWKAASLEREGRGRRRHRRE